MNAVEPFKDGLLIYEPWYSRIMESLEHIERYLNLPVSVSVSGVYLPEIMNEIVLELGNLTLTISSFGAIWLLALKISNRIYRGVRAEAETTVAVSATAEANVIAE